jgi:hypothetical protein
MKKTALYLGLVPSLLILATKGTFIVGIADLSYSYALALDETDARCIIDHRIVTEIPQIPQIDVFSCHL